MIDVPPSRPGHEAPANGYRIAYDANRHLLEAEVIGFWTMQTLQGFAREFAAAMTDLRARGIAFAVLGDGRRFAVQSQEVSAGLMRMVDPANQSNRAFTAILVASALVKMQAQRAMSAPHLRVFDDREQALAWLVSTGSVK